MTRSDSRALKIGFDLRYLQAAYRNSSLGGIGGVGVYSRGLWKAIARLYPETELVALVDRGDIPQELSELVGNTQKSKIVPFGLFGLNPLLNRMNRSSYSWLISALESEFLLGISRKSACFDVLHVLHQNPAPKGVGPTVMTIHDCCPFGAGKPVKKGVLEKIRQRYLKSVSRSDRLVCVSESTRNDVNFYLKGCSEKTEVIYSGVNLETFKPCTVDKEEVKKKFHISTPFFINVGVCSGRKNPRGLLKGMQIAVQNSDLDFKLLLVGPYQVDKSAEQFIIEVANEYGISDKILILGDLNDEDLVMLYRNALALVFPSFYEGFGFPAVEALACGTQCIVSSTSSLPEAVGNLGVLVNPTSAREIGNAIASIAHAGKSNLVQQEGPRWAQKFSWENAARAYMKIYQELAREAQIARRNK